ADPGADGVAWIGAAERDLRAERIVFDRLGQDREPTFRSRRCGICLREACPRRGSFMAHRDGLFPGPARCIGLCSPGAGPDSLPYAGKMKTVVRMRLLAC